MKFSISFFFLFGIPLLAQEPPTPVLPVPTPRQLAWQEREFIGFIHFSLTTYVDKEWGYGDEPASLFDPAKFDPDSIVKTMKDAGMKEIILTCKHHNGFCLWPSKYTNYSVKSSPWKNGKGDMVKDFSESCRRFGLGFGVYLSPWDRNHKNYGKPEYVAYYRNQLRELLTEYGDIAEVWFDGANGGSGYYGGANATRTIDRKSYYEWPNTWKLVRDLQPNAVMFSDIGPDVRWVGNENGAAGETCWSSYSPVGEQGGEASIGDVRASESPKGHRDGQQWLPPECDVSIRPGWFYHERENSSVKSPEQLFDLYSTSVGRNGVFLLNVPLDRSGRIHANDVRSLRGFKRLVDSTFAHNRLQGANVTASNVRGGSIAFAGRNVLDGNNRTFWTCDDSVASASLEFMLPSPQMFDCVMLQEPVSYGQRIESFAVEIREQDSWNVIARGTTVGYKRLLRFPPQTASRMRVRIERSKAVPILSTVGLFLSSH